MNPLTTGAFDLPDHLTAKADPTLIAGDEQHFAAIAESIEQSIEREHMANVVDDLLEADDDGEGAVTMLRATASAEPQPRAVSSSLDAPQQHTPKIEPRWDEHQNPSSKRGAVLARR